MVCQSRICGIRRNATAAVLVLLVMAVLLPNSNAFGFGGRPMYRGSGGFDRYNPYRPRQTAGYGTYHQPQQPQRYHQPQHHQANRYPPQPQGSSYHQPSRQQQPMYHSRESAGGAYEQYNNPRRTQVVPRKYEVQEFNDRFEIYVEAPEVYKGEGFQVTLDEDTHTLRVKDRTRGFDESWEVPKSVLKQDIVLSDRRMRGVLTVIVPKQGSRVPVPHYPTSSSKYNEPSPKEDWSREQKEFKEERPWDSFDDAHVVRPRRLTVQSAPLVIDDELDVRDISFPAPVLKARNAVSGYVNMQGDFVSY